MKKSSILAAASLAVDVVMSIVTLQIQIDPCCQNLNVSVNLTDNFVRDRVIVKNTGNVNQDYALKVTSTTGSGWTLVTGSPGTNEYRLSALWHEWSPIPATTEFQSNDVLTSSDQTSSDSVFFNEVSETHSVFGTKGYLVPPDNERNLFIWIQGPSGGSGSLTAHLGLTVLASP